MNTKTTVEIKKKVLKAVKFLAVKQEKKVKVVVEEALTKHLTTNKIGIE
jgi:hypothetical protein